jgi:hypothetical protein
VINRRTIASVAGAAALALATASWAPALATEPAAQGEVGAVGPDLVIGAFTNPTIAPIPTPVPTPVPTPAASDTTEPSASATTEPSASAAPSAPASQSPQSGSAAGSSTDSTVPVALVGILLLGLLAGVLTLVLLGRQQPKGRPGDGPGADSES